ncbi:cobalamin biosynthesis protein CobE [Pseudomonas sp. Leaf58]|uniref:cobalamin biosynthesis protein n=1 Tax=Pseudomonas sp. Leaf58 TaxID=1736226 RepID=UPI0006F76AF7|nr:cobalamin biosynthesis protein [Pseudomonas sp. Leaf58]AYG44939.1 cobalamin biosynthesis protein CobE [Pseudomonas sp. Leaf58]KQN65576.1 cobalamin biosynthesis protein CobE [Pseudomonas sp. Leaf58]
MPAFYAGLGCRRGCPVTTLATLLCQALSHQGLALADLHGIASISLKADEPALQQLAERLGVPLVLYDIAVLQPYEPQLSHRSAAAHAHTGCWGVAESAALALASQRLGRARLLLTRQVLGPATLALAY